MFNVIKTNMTTKTILATNTSLFTWMSITGMPNLVISDASELGPLQRKFYFRLLHKNGKNISPCYVLGFNIDKVAPTISIGTPSPTSISTSSGTLTFAVSTTEISLTSLSASQVTLGGTATGCNKAVSGSSPNFNIEVSGCSTAGTVNVSLSAGLTADGEEQALQQILIE